MSEKLKEMLVKLEALEREEIMLMREGKHKESNEAFNAYRKLRDEYYELKSEVEDD